jgi:hypothetical protein
MYTGSAALSCSHCSIFFFTTTTLSSSATVQWYGNSFFNLLVWAGLLILFALPSDSTRRLHPVLPWFLPDWRLLNELAVFLHLLAAPLCDFISVLTNRDGWYSAKIALVIVVVVVVVIVAVQDTTGRMSPFKRPNISLRLSSIRFVSFLPKNQLFLKFSSTFRKNRSTIR